jgi:asparagine synthase (glutamine-hydrolysing)
MCGYILSTIKNKKKFLSLKKYIIHRGPDSQNYKKINNCLLYHSRLKIIDIKSRSNQPFTDKEKKHFLLFNGEIYNYLELKDKFNIKINTSSDTEILFFLLKNYGLKKTLKEIKGMFSFVFFDVQQNIISGARDHFGQKPLYFTKNSPFSCSTNIKPLTKLIKKISFDKDSINFYLNSSGILPINKTIYKNILSLPAGNYFRYNLNTKNLIIKEYFHPSDLISKKYSLFLKKKDNSFIKKELKLKILQAVKNCLISDVKVGTLLSGGIDSSLITYFARKINPRINSFTGTSEGIEKIPKKIVPKIIKKIKLINPKFVVHKSNDYIKKLYELVTRSYSPSRWGGGVPMSNICKVAKKNKIKVLLSGDGVDELCGGYKTFSKIDLNFKNNYHQIIDVRNQNRLVNKYKKFLIKNRKKIEKKMFFIKSKKEKMKQVLFIEDTNIFLQTCTLPHGDEYSMHESIELRNPFLDLNLVYFLTNLESKHKSQIKNFDNNGKKLFKDIAEKIFGKMINQDKEGTRNYSSKISNKVYWNFNKFKIFKKYKIKQNNLDNNKKIFKIINLEILYRYSILKERNFNFKSILSTIGYKYFY